MTTIKCKTECKGSLGMVQKLSAAVKVTSVVTVKHIYCEKIEHTHIRSSFTNQDINHKHNSIGISVNSNAPPFDICNFIVNSLSTYLSCFTQSLITYIMLDSLRWHKGGKLC